MDQSKDEEEKETKVSHELNVDSSNTNSDLPDECQYFGEKSDDHISRDNENKFFNRNNKRPAEVPIVAPKPKIKKKLHTVISELKTSKEVSNALPTAISDLSQNSCLQFSQYLPPNNTQLSENSSNLTESSDQLKQWDIPPSSSKQYSIHDNSNSENIYRPKLSDSLVASASPKVKCKSLFNYSPNDKSDSGENTGEVQEDYINSAKRIKLSSEECESNLDESNDDNSSDINLEANETLPSEEQDMQKPYEQINRGGLADGFNKPEKFESIPIAKVDPIMESSSYNDDSQLKNESDSENSAKEKSDNENSDCDDVNKDNLMGGSTGLSARPKVKNMRKNIRDIIADDKLEEDTLAAQKEEQLRLQRLQDKRVAMREYIEQQQVERLVAEVAEAAEAVTAAEAVQEVESSEEVVSQVEPIKDVKKEAIEDDDVVVLSSEDSGSDSKDSEPDEESEPEIETKPLLLPKLEVKSEKESETSESEESESESDSDVVVLSHSEEEDDPEEDVNNCGAHVNDDFNCPDVNGCVLVNVGHPDKEENIYLAPQLAAAIKPHQIGGLRFLYDNIVESLEQFKNSNGFGCILAHSMGLGKTLQVISLTDVFLRHTISKYVLIIVPINTLVNWLTEYNHWLPEEVPAGLPDGTDFRTRNFKVFLMNDSTKTIKARAKVINEWHKQGGVLLMGYEMYRQLSLKKPKKTKKKKRKNQNNQDDIVDIEEEDSNKEYLDEMHKALVRPGPDLIICDEGHRIKNAHANISQALKSIRTRRRIVLTGYPLQNNLLEYWCMVDFVRPNYLGTKTEFSNMFERPIQNGQCVDSTPQDVRLMRHRAHVLHSLLEGFVQRRGHSVLASTLPMKHEHVILCRLTPIQRKLYTAYMDELTVNKGMANPLKAFAICCKIWNHPDILYNLVMKRLNEDLDLDLDEVVGKPGSKGKKGTPANSKAADKRKGGKQNQILNCPNESLPVSNNSALKNCKQEPNSPINMQQSFEQSSMGPPQMIPQQQNCIGPNNPQQQRMPMNNNSNDHSNMGYAYSNMYNMQQQPPYMNQMHYPWGGYNQGYPPENNAQYMQSYNMYPPQYPHNMHQNQSDQPTSYPMSPGNVGRIGPERDDNQNRQNGCISSTIERQNETMETSNSLVEDQNSTKDCSSMIPMSQNQMKDGSQMMPMPHNQIKLESQMMSMAHNPMKDNSQMMPMALNQIKDEPQMMPMAHNPMKDNQQMVPMALNPMKDNPQMMSIAHNPMKDNSQMMPMALNQIKDEPQIIAMPHNQIKLEPQMMSMAHNPMKDNPQMMQMAHNPMKDIPQMMQMSHNPNTVISAHVEHNISNDMNLCEDMRPIVNNPHAMQDPSCKFNYMPTPSPKISDQMSNLTIDRKDYMGTNCMLPNMKSQIHENNMHQNFGQIPKMSTFEKLNAKNELDEEKRDEFKKEDSRREEISLEWAESHFKDYVPGLLETSTKFQIFFQILEGTLAVGDRILVFSQSLFTLSQLEEFMQKYEIPGTTEKWAKNRSYFRLDGSTTAQERDKLITEFNNNSAVKVFLVSTRAGSLGINLVGANRVIVFDASFNPCHDTQAVCRIYRYGQHKDCHIYRMVTDNSLERRIYDRQVNKQGISDRIVDEMNPEAHLSSKEISNLLVEKEEDPNAEDFSDKAECLTDPIFKSIVTENSHLLTRTPFRHESLLVDRKDKKLSNAEKRLAKRSYEMEKRANTSYTRPSYSSFYPKTTGAMATKIGGIVYAKPVGTVRPMQHGARHRMDGGLVHRPNILSGASNTPVESLAKQGVSVQQITVPKDVSIPTNAGDGKPIQLKGGQSVMVIKTQKGMYLRLADGKIVAIRIPPGIEDAFGLPLSQGSVTIVPTTYTPRSRSVGPGRGGSSIRRGRPPLSAQYALGNVVPKGFEKNQMSAVRIIRRPASTGRGARSAYQTIAVPVSGKGALLNKSVVITPAKSGQKIVPDKKISPKVQITPVPAKSGGIASISGTSGLNRRLNRNNKLFLQRAAGTKDDDKKHSGFTSDSSSDDDDDSSQEIPAKISQMYAPLDKMRLIADENKFVKKESIVQMLGTMGKSRPNIDEKAPLLPTGEVAAELPILQEKEPNSMTESMAPLTSSTEFATDKNAFVPVPPVSSDKPIKENPATDSLLNPLSQLSNLLPPDDRLAPMPNTFNPIPHSAASYSQPVYSNHQLFQPYLQQNITSSSGTSQVTQQLPMTPALDPAKSWSRLGDELPVNSTDSIHSMNTMKTQSNFLPPSTTSHYQSSLGMDDQAKSSKDVSYQTEGNHITQVSMPVEEEKNAASKPVVSSLPNDNPLSLSNLLPEQAQTADIPVNPPTSLDFMNYSSAFRRVDYPPGEVPSLVHTTTTSDMVSTTAPPFSTTTAASSVFPVPNPTYSQYPTYDNQNFRAPVMNPPTYPYVNQFAPYGHYGGPQASPQQQQPPPPQQQQQQQQYSGIQTQENYPYNSGNIPPYNPGVGNFGQGPYPPM